MEENNLLNRFLSLFNRSSKNALKYYFSNRASTQINRGQVWIDTAVPYELYNTIPQLKTPVDKLAAMFSNGVFKLQKIGSDELMDLPPDLKKLLENPNMSQAQNTMLKNYLTQLIVYGNQFMYGNWASKLSDLPVSLIPVSPACTIPNLTGKYFDQIDMSGVVKNYEYREDGYVRYFNTDEIMWNKIADLDNLLVGASPLKAMKFPLTNTRLAYQYLNVISAEKGAIGVLSPNGKDSIGPIALTPEERKQQEAFYRQDNGIEDDQKKINISNVPMLWSPISYPTKDLLLMEQIDANFLTILNVLGVNQNLFINSTYDNLRHGLIQTHNDTVVPYADEFTQSLSKFLGLQEGTRLILDYSHLPYLQVDKKSEAETLSTVSNALNTLVQGGIINASQAGKLLLNQFGIKT